MFKSVKEEMLEADRRYMADLLRRARAAYAAAPAYVKRDLMRRIEDGQAAAAKTVRDEEHARILREVG